MGWKLNLSNLGPLHVKAKSVGYKGPLQGNFVPVDKEKERQVQEYMKGQKEFTVGREWGGDFSNLGPLGQRVKPMYFSFSKGGKKKAK